MSDNAVSLKLPVFWSQQPSVWFAQAEAQFAIREIKDETTKYYYLVAALDQETAVRVLDDLQVVPKSKPYSTLKQRLVDTFVMSDYEKAAAILHMPPLGDQKPSQMMDRMLGLLGSSDAKILLRQVFLERLPEQVRSVLVHSGEDDNRKLAKAADKLYEAHQTCTTSVNKITNKKPASKPSADKPQDNKTRMCYFHKKFGAKAHKCVIPCSWEAGNTEAGSQ